MEEERGRALVALFGVDEDDGLYVLIVGIILVAIAFTACFYCKVYDPTKRFCIKKWRKYCTRVPLEESPPTPDTPPMSERNHWYLNKTLAIDRRDKDELGPIGDIKGLQGGWYGARNGGFNV